MIDNQIKKTENEEADPTALEENDGEFKIHPLY